MAKGDYKYFTEEEKKAGMRRCQKKYTELNKETINEKARDKIICKVCNCEIARSSKARHEKLQKHLNNLENRKIVFSK